MVDFRCLVFLALFPPQVKRGQVKRSKDRVSKLYERYYANARLRTNFTICMTIQIKCYLSLLNKIN